MATAPSVGSLPAWSSRPAKCRLEALRFARVGDRARQLLGRAHVGAEQHGELRAMALGRFLRRGLLRGAGRAATLTPDPRTTSGRELTPASSGLRA